MTPIYKNIHPLTSYLVITIPKVRVPQPSQVANKIHVVRDQHVQLAPHQGHPELSDGPCHAPLANSPCSAFSCFNGSENGMQTSTASVNCFVLSFSVFLTVCHSYQETGSIMQRLVPDVFETQAGCLQSFLSFRELLPRYQIPTR